MKNLLDKLATLVQQRIKDKIWMKVRMMLSILVVFCTTYALILPALTLSTSTSDSIVQDKIQTTKKTEETSSEVLPEVSSVESQAEKKSGEKQVSSETETTTQSKSTSEKKPVEKKANDGTLAGKQSVTVDSKTTVSATYGVGTFSEHVTLQVKAIHDTQSIDQKLSTILDKTQQSVSDAKSYDISFMSATGDEVEPTKEVSVSMSFEDGGIAGKPYASWKLYHFKDGAHQQVEELTSQPDTKISENNTGDVTSLAFKSDTFSTYTVANVTYADFSSFLKAYTYNQANFDNATQALTVLDLSLTYHISQEALVNEKNYYLSLPADSAIGKDIELGKTYTGRDGNGVAALTYSFQKDASGNYYVLISFLDSYVSTIAKGADSKGFLTYDATFGTDYKKNDGSYVVEYSDDIRVTIEPEKIATLYDVNVAKKGQVSYDGDQPYLTYTVTVFSENGSPADISLTDILTANGLSIAVIDQVSVRKGTYTSDPSNLQNSEILPATTYSYKFDKAINKLEMTLPQLISGGLDHDGKKIGQAYDITYRYKVSGLSVGETVDVKNKATAVSDNGKTDGKKTGSGETKVKLKLNDITKTSQGYDPATGLVKWSVTVNPDKNDIAGALLTDTLFDSVSDLVLSPDNGYTIEKDNAGKITGIKFKAVEGNKNTQTYTITYKTKVDQSQIGWSGTTIKNNVTLDNDGNPKTTNDQTHASAEEKISGLGKLSKSQTGSSDTADEQIKEITWTSEVSLPSSGVLPSGITFVDILRDPYVQNAERHWYTLFQLQTLYSDLAKIFGTDGFTLSARQNSWGDYTAYADLDAKVHYTEYQITLTKDYTGPDFNFSYHSMINVTSGKQFKNTVNSGTHTSSYDYNYERNSRVTKMDGNANESASNTTSEYGTVTWQVRVKLPEDATTMTVVDDLPEAVSLVGLQYGQRWGQISANLSGNNITSGANGWGTFNIDLSGTVAADGKVTLNFTAQNGTTLRQNIGNNEEFWLTFTTKYTKVPTEGQTTVGLNNFVSVVVNHEDFGSDSQKQTVTVGKKKEETPSEKIISKSGQWDNDNRLLSYNVAINPEAKVLADGAEMLTVTDTLKIYGVDISEELVQSSVQLLDAQGKLVDPSEWSWKISSTDDGWGNHTHTLIVTIKNATKYTLSYQYKITKLDPSLTATYWPHNTVKIEGVSEGSGENTVAVNWQRTGTTSGIETEKGYTINKVEANNFGISLPNAIFTVYELDADNDNSNDKAVATYTTNAHGNFTILFSSGKFSYNKVYYAVETTSPSGYDIPDNPSRYYFYFKGTTGVPPYLPEGTVDLSERSKTSYVENEKVASATIKVDKKWLDADGIATDLVDASITVHLVQVSTSKKDSSVTETTIAKSVISKADLWTTTFDKLPVTGVDAQGNPVNYTYKVIEDPVSGYQTTYSNTGANGVTVPISSGEVSIINQAQKSYLLPKTGGRGIKTIMITGMMMAILAFVLLLIMGYKKCLKGGEFL